jgi:hypothetical protein
MAANDLVSVYLAPDAFKADIIKNMLEEEGIRAIVDGETQGPFEGSIMVDVKVLVEEGQAEEARKLIQEHEDQVIADGLADLEKGEDESDSESEIEAPPA